MGRADLTSTVEELRRARPAVDQVAKDDARARIAHALFEVAEPARVGRFVLLGPIARGGMGVVYGAYDPELERRVALKLVHPDQRATPEARERMLREARTLARLAHPNVVPVHDVTVIDDQVVIVMELVAGQTVAAWEEAAARSWRELVAVYLEAGRGLAAAHEVGLVHRDFKPANAIVGDDGRVRVLDFGLARVVGDPTTGEASVPAAAGRAPAFATGDGAVVGTLGYMAPEQLAGGAVTARSDQFSFCVALHRALHAVAPYPGTTVEELRASIASGRRAYAADGRRVPGWLRAAIDRGLAADPADRHPSMRELLALLARERGWRRWRVPAVATLGLAATVTAALVVRDERDPVAACDAGGDRIAAAWGPGRREELRRHLAGIDSPAVPALITPILDGLDGYAADWSAAHHDACVAHVQRARSDTLHDRSMACLRRRADGLAEAVAVLASADATSIDRARDVAGGLAPLADCTDDDILDAEAAPPPSPIARAAVEALRRELQAAEALERAGRSHDALTLARALAVRAEQLAYPPAVVEVLLVEGRVLIGRDDLTAAVAPLRRAEELALAQRWLTPAVTAAARRIYAEARTGAEPARLLGEAAVLEPLSRDLPGDRFARPLLLNNLGVVHMARQDPEAARRNFAAARAARDLPVGEPALELAIIDSNLAMVTPDPGEREALARAAWTALGDRLGAPHLSTLAALWMYAHYVAEPARSIALVRDACAGYRTYHPELVARRAECASYLAFLTSETGGDPTPLYAGVVALTAGTADPEAAYFHHLAAGHTALAAGDAARAHAAFTDALRAGAEHGDQAEHAAHAHLGLALAEAARSRDRAAAAHLAQSIATFTERAAASADAEPRQRLAFARRHLAQLTAPRERDRP
jgi:predicted Ser/Thr protein kinase